MVPGKDTTMTILIDIGIAAGTALTGGGWRYIYIRSRTRSRHTAITSLNGAAEHYGELEAKLVADDDDSLKGKVNAFVATLGQTDAAAFRQRYENEITTAQAAMMLYDNLTVDSEHRRKDDPTVSFPRHRRKTYNCIASAHAKAEQAIQAAIERLDSLLADIVRLRAEIAEFAATRETTNSGITAVRSYLTQLSELQWQVGSHQQELAAADRCVELADAAQEQYNGISAINWLAEARQHSAGAQSGAQALTAALAKVTARLDESAVYLRQLRGRLVLAGGKLKALQAAYAESCSAGMPEELEGAREHLDMLEVRITDARTGLTPAAFNQATAATAAKQIGSELNQVDETIERISTAKSQLDDYVRKLWISIEKFQQSLSDANGRAHRRKGNQGQIFQAIQYVSVELSTASDLLAALKPDPADVNARLHKIKGMITRIEQRSKAIHKAANDDTDSDDLLGAFGEIAGIAAAVVGLDWLFGN
jgi:hypothetical protein